MRILSSMAGREALSLGRSHRMLLLRLVAVAAVLGLVVASLYGQLHSSFKAIEDEYSPIMLNADTSQLGAMLYQRFIDIIQLLVFLVVPLLTAPVVAREREQRTLGLLMLSNLKPRQILLDKLLVRLGYLFLLLATILPLNLLFLRLGGTASGIVLRNAWTMTMDFAWLLVLGLICTAVARTTIGALIGTYLLAILTHLPFALMERIGSGSAMYPGYNPYRYEYMGADFRSESILKQILSFLTFPQDADRPAMVVASGAILAVLVGVLSFVCWRLPRLADDTGPGWTRRIFSWVDRFYERLSSRGKRFRDRSPLKRRPVLWRELHGHFYTSNVFCLRLLLLMAVLVIGGTIVVYRFDDDFLLLFRYFLQAIFLIVAMVVGSSSFANDHEKDLFSTLLSTPVPAWQFILGKWLGALKLLAILSLAVIALYGIDAFYLDSLSLEIRSLVSYFLLLLATLSTGILFSLILKRTRVALVSTAATVGLIGFLFTRYNSLLALVLISIACFLISWRGFNRFTGRAG